MQLTPEQDNVVRRVDQWYHDTSGPQVFRLFGYAGTGKTTLARYFAEQLGVDVLFGAFTGKAAYVLMQKGCPGATTLHKLLYHTRDKARARLVDLEDTLKGLLSELQAEGHSQDTIDEHRRVLELRRQIREEEESLARPSFVLNPDSPVRDADLVIVDEVSMVDQAIGQDLLSFGTKVLVLGDPAQLPPVAGGGFFTNAEPDVMLEQIHRQALDNPIIELATRVRRGESLPLGQYGQSAVVEKSGMSPERAMQADQVLVGRNRVRRATNRRVRELNGLDPDSPPVPGDRLVCLRNNHELGLLNGAIWNVSHVNRVTDDSINFDLVSEEGWQLPEVWAHMQYFKDTEEKLPWWQRMVAEEFDYGYVLTVHKSQGSQWDDVVLFDESSIFREHARRWLYTGITRAAESVTVVRS